MAAKLRNAQWDTSPVRHQNKTITYVYCRIAGGGWEPWTVIAPSALLRRVGIESLGLYAARPFKRDDYVGVYPMNEIVGRYASREEALLAPEARKRLMSGRDKLITVRAQGGGVLLLDGESGGGAEVQRANDPRGTSLRPNAVITEGGYLRVTNARVPAFHLDKSVDDNIGSELRISYGDDFWALQDVLGTSRAFAIQVD
jgi:hypothetical protein